VAVNGTNAIICVSTNDGASWTAVRLPTPTTTSNSVAFGGGYFVVTIAGSPFAFYSADGYNWEFAISPAASTTRPTGIAYGNGYWNTVANASGTANYQWASNSLYPVSYSIKPTYYNATS